MTWATPGIAWIAAAIAVPTLLILYFLKLRRRNVDVSSTLLWRKAIQDLHANAPFQKLRRNILLLLQLLVLAAILFALAQPQMMSDQTTGQLKIFMIDRSASMNASDGDPDSTREVSRLERAKEFAIDEVDAMREAGLFSDERADQAMVIAYDANAVVVQQFTSDKDALRAAIRGIKPSDGPSRLKEAMQLAKSRKAAKTFTDNKGDPAAEGETREIEGLTAGPPQEIHIFSDGRLVDAGEVIPAVEDSVLYHAIGTPQAKNLGITSVRAERSYDNPIELTIFAAVENTDSVARSVDVELRVDGVPVATKEITIPASVSTGVTSNEEDEDGPTATRAAPGTGGIAFPLEMSRGALVEVRLAGLDEGDVLETDNIGYLIVPPAEQTAVAVVSPDDIFIGEALSGLPLSRLDVFTPGQFDALLKDGRSAEYDVIVLDRWIPESVGEALPPGRWLIFGAVPTGPGGLIDAGDGGLTTVMDAKTDHPVLRSFTLDPLVIAKMRKVELPEDSGAQVLAETPQGPAIIEISGVEYRAIVVPWEIEQSNWPFQVGFVVFLGGAIDYLSSDSYSEAEAGGAARQFRPGEILADRLPLDAANVDVTRVPGGEPKTTTPTGDGRITFGPIERTGVYRVRWTGSAGATDVVDAGRVSRFFAANMSSSDESDVRTAEQMTLASQTVTAQQNETRREVRRLWPWLLLAALAMVMFEWFIYNRKVYV
jgi:VWA domain-containing protein/aerotolerance regulator-like protein